MAEWAGERLDNPMAYAAGFAPEVSVRPLRLHTPMVEGTLGGHCFSADFARYLAKVKPRLVVAWQLRVDHWWASPYGRERVRRGFIGRYGSERGGERYRVALCQASGFQHAPTLELMSRHSGYWSSEQTHIAQRFASGH